MQSIGYLICLAVLVVILSVVCYCYHRNKKIVLENSTKIKSLLELNSETSFDILQSVYSNHFPCNSKRSFDRFSMDDYLIYLIERSPTFYHNIIQSVNRNINAYHAYMNRVRAIESSATEEFCKQIRIKYTTFIRYENRIFQKEILEKPQTDVEVYCKATYTSPAGRKYYSMDQSYSFSQLNDFYNCAIQLKKERDVRQHQIKVERAKMTDSLRYDILRRDGFRCQICGSSAQDGVKLHVDHIIPVSRGGLTVPSNLRTLCDRCNMGKSDKM